MDKRVEQFVAERRALNQKVKSNKRGKNICHFCVSCCMGMRST